MLDSQSIAVQTKTSNYAFANCRNIAFMSEFFPGVHVGDMHLNYRTCDSGNSISNCNRSMRKSPGINNDTINFKTDFMDLVYYFRFRIGLKLD